MPLAIEHSVRKQNIKFMHNRNQFSAEYFQFIKKLVSCNSYVIETPNLNEKLVSRFNSPYVLPRKGFAVTFRSYYCRAPNTKNSQCCPFNCCRNSCFTQVSILKRHCAARQWNGTISCAIFCAAVNLCDPGLLITCYLIIRIGTFSSAYTHLYARIQETSIFNSE